MNIRDELSVRLQSEIKRKGTNSERISYQTKQPIDVIDGYLTGNREIQFDELRPICESLRIALMWLLSPNYQQSHLIFRALEDQDLAKVSRIENAFLIIGSLLPKVKNFSVPRLDISQNDPAMLQAEINGALSNIRQTYPKVEDLYLATGLPILPVSAGENGFDAFIMTFGKSSVVCVNRDKPPARIHFSLLHEMAHFLWHKGQDVPVDMAIFESCGKQDIISESNIPEYIANKFAQQYIFSWKETESLAPIWKSIPNIADLLAERRTTPDVLAFAIYDYMKLSPRPVQFEQIRSALRDKAGVGWGRDRTVLDFVEQRGRELKSALYQNREEFSDSVWAEIKAAWELSID
jgi:Zn-dependent peptidase ImmA (M78 family)